MKNKTKSKIIIIPYFILVILVGMVIRSIFFLQVSGMSNDKNKDITSEVKVKVFPVHITIPKIALDAKIIQVGISSDGIMEAPIGPTEAGWFDLGVLPGEKGSAVIDGHSGWKNGISAVFDELDKLRKGDKVYIQDEKGKIMIFVVKKFELYDPSAYSGSIFNSNDSKAHLNLITCDGVWDSATKTSSSRLVVYTEME